MSAMSSITDENAVANIMASGQETSSPQKPVIHSPDAKVVDTPSTAFESPDALASPELEEEPSWLASALPQIGEATQAAEIVSWVAEALSAEAPSEEDLALMRYLPKLRTKAETLAWVAEALSAETPTAEDLAWLRYLPKLRAKAETAPWAAEALSAETPTEEDLALMSCLPKLKSKAEPVPWVAEALSAETPTEEDLELMRYLPKLRSKVSREPPSWIAAALLYESIEAEYDLAAMRADDRHATLDAECDSAASRYLPSRVHPRLIAETSSKIFSTACLERSPNYDSATKAAAFAKLARKAEDSDSEDDDSMRRAALSQLKEECASAAAYVVTEEEWRGQLSKECEIFAPALAYILPRGPSIVTM